MANVIEITVRVDDQASAKAAEIEEKLRGIADAAKTNVTAGIGVGLEDDGLREKVIEAVRTAERNIAVIVGIDLEDEGLREKVVEAVQRAEKGLKVVVDADVRTDKIRNQLKEGAGGEVEVPLEPDATGFEEKLRRKTKQAKVDPVEVPVEPKTDDFEAEFRKAMDEADKASESAARDIRSSFTAVESGSRSLRAAMADLAPDAQGAGSAVDEAGDKASSGGKKASDAGMNFSFLHSRMVLLTAAAFTLAPALAAIPAAMGAVAAGGALMTFGLGGVITALKDYGAQSASAGESSAQMALTAFTNAVAIRNAEQTIADAKRQAAIQQENSADSIVAAQERLANAQDTEKQSTEALNQAWKDAVNTLADLNNASADAVNSVADAQLALQAAQDSANKTVSSSLSTDLQKQQALQSVKDAQQHLTDAQQQALEAQQAADDANAKGVAGSTGVTQAQRAQAQAAQGVADAQHALVVAQRNAAQAQQQSAEQIQKAVQNLSDTYQQQQLAAAAAAASGSSAANKFATDMANLTPAGQALVKQLLAMKDGAKELSTTAQTSMLPGLTSMLKDSTPLLPIFNGALRDMGTIVGNTATNFGKLFQLPLFQGQLKTIFKEGTDAVGTLGAAFPAMVSGLAQGAAQAGPIVQGIASGLSSIMVKGLPEFLAGLTQNAQGTGSAFQGIGQFIANLGGPLGTIASALVSSLAPAIQVLASPAMQQALQSIADLIAAILQVAGPLITAIAQGLVGALRFLNPMLEATTKFLRDNHSWLTPLAGIIAGITAAWWLWNSAILGSPIGWIIAGIAGILMGLIYLWEHFKGFRDFIHDVWHDISQWTQDAMEWAVKQWQGLVEFVKGVPGMLLSAGAHVWSWLVDKWNEASGWVHKQWDQLVTDVTGLPGRLASVGAHIWDFLADSFKTAINRVILFWDSLNFSTPSIHIPGTPSSWDIPSVVIGMPPISTFKAVGGPLSGLLAHVGEAGTEALRMPTGTVVIPHNNTASMLESGAFAGRQQASIQIEWVGGSAGDEFMTWLRKNIRIRGGGGPNSVQRVLGQ